MMKYMIPVVLSLSASAEGVQFTKDHSINCLALNIYHEARGDNYAGQVAVADVVLNRVEDVKYPNTVCEVVHQAKLSDWWLDQGKEIPVRNQCQFSWYCDGKSDNPQNERAWNQSVAIAYTMMRYDSYRGITEGATHYHAEYVNPYWASSMQVVGRIGEHIFYRTIP
jgi:spore germination cell wall hydrolase CwlJ-like protein